MAGDSNWASVALLLHGDGANGSTVIKDSSSSARAVTAVGNASISTAQSKFGGSSLAFDGSGDYLSVGSAGDSGFAMGSGDFTIEAFVYPTNFTSNPTIFGCYGGPRSGAYLLRLTSGNLVFYLYPDGYLITSSTTLSLNTWNHVALCRSSGTFYMFINGTPVGSAASATSLTADPSHASTVGAYWQSSSIDSSTYFYGYIEELRISKGLARYTTTFTPPSSPYPDGMGEIQGIVTDSAGSPCARTVRAYRRDTGALVASGTSDGSTGAYTIYTPTLDEVTVLALDDATVGTIYNDVCERVIPA